MAQGNAGLSQQGHRKLGAGELGVPGQGGLWEDSPLDEPPSRVVPPPGFGALGGPGAADCSASEMGRRCFGGLPTSSLVKKLPGSEKMQQVSAPSRGREDPLEKGPATHSSIPAWRKPRPRGFCWAAQCRASHRLHSAVTAHTQALWLSSFGRRAWSKPARLHSELVRGCCQLAAAQSRVSRLSCV